MKEKIRKVGKLLLKWGLIGLVVLIVIKMIMPGEKSKAPKKPVSSAVAANTNPDSWDLSQRREETIQESRELPAASENKQLTLTLPCYRVDGGIMWY